MSRDKRLNHAQEVVGSIPISSCKVRGDRLSARLSTRTEHLEILEVSGQVDLNHRPHGPEPCALTRLSYAPRGRTAPRARKETRILGEPRTGGQTLRGA